MRGGVRKRYGNWYYYFDVGKVGGKRKKIERKAVGAIDKKDAERILRKALAEYENTGVYFEPSQTTLHDYLDYWLEESVELNLKHNTIENYKIIVNNHIKPALGLIKLRSLTPEMLQVFINDKYRKGYAKKTMTIFHSVLKSALDKAVYPYQLIKVNPMHYVKVPKYEETIKTKKDFKILSIDVIKKIKNHLSENHPFYVPFHIGLNTGMRVSEVCALTWDCVDLDNGIIKIDKIVIRKNREWVFGTPKTKSSYREIEIGSTLINILKKENTRQKQNKLKYGEFYISNSFVCKKDNGKPVTPNVCKYHGEKLRNELDIDFNFHSLRHTHATLLMESGAKPKAIQERLGHSRLGITTDTYSHLTKKMQREVVDIFESAMHD